jgi:hypothetical protein
MTDFGGIKPAIIGWAKHDVLGKEGVLRIFEP